MELGQTPLVLLMAMAVALDLMGRAFHRGRVVRRLYKIYDTVQVLSEKRQTGTATFWERCREERMYAEAERLLWYVGIDFRGALEEIQQKDEERRRRSEIAGRLLEINSEFRAIADGTLYPDDDLEAIRRQDELYDEAEELLPQLGYDPKEHLQRGRPKSTV